MNLCQTLEFWDSDSGAGDCTPSKLETAIVHSKKFCETDLNSWTVLSCANSRSCSATSAQFAEYWETYLPSSWTSQSSQICVARWLSNILCFHASLLSVHIVRWHERSMKPLLSFCVFNWVEARSIWQKPPRPCPEGQNGFDVWQFTSWGEGVWCVYSF